MERRPRGQFYWQEVPPRAHDDWWSGPLHALVIVLLLILLIAGVIWIVRRLSNGAVPAAAPALATAGAGMQVVAHADDPAVSTLRMRYARGEVSRDDFRHTMEDLTGAPTPTDAWPGDGTAADTAVTEPGEEPRAPSA